MPSVVDTELPYQAFAALFGFMCKGIGEVEATVIRTGTQGALLYLADGAVGKTDENDAEGDTRLPLQA